MKKKPPALKLAEPQRNALLAAIENLNKRQTNGNYILQQKGFTYRVLWEYDNHTAQTIITVWMTFQEIKNWIASEKRCLK